MAELVWPSPESDDLGRGYTLEVTIAFFDASTSDVVFRCTAEGFGRTEADDIEIAINRCLESF